MPGRDRTGPMGTGPFGRGMGPYSSGEPFPGNYAGGGWGRRWRTRFWSSGWGQQLPTMSPEEEISALKQRETWLNRQLEWVKKRLKDSEEQGK